MTRNKPNPKKERMMKQIVNWAAGVMAMLLLLLPACTQDEEKTTLDYTDKVAFRLALSGLPASRSLSESTEEMLYWIDVFLIDKDNSMYYERITEPSTSDIVYLKADKKDYTGKQPLSVYVVANSSHTEEEFKAVTNLDALKAMMETTYFYQTETPDRFLMDGSAEVNNLDDAISINLKRAAAKIVVTLKYETEERDGKTYAYTAMGGVEKKMVNYAVTSSILESAGMLPVDQRNLQSPTGAQWWVKITSNNNVVFYTYATNIALSDEFIWENEPYLLLNVPVTEKIKADGTETSTNYSANYYRIPLNGFGWERLERNHLYQIGVTIRSLGSATPDTPIELTDVSYKVADWTDQTIDIKGKDHAAYLAVNKNSYEITNAEEDFSLKFNSSSKVTVTVESCTYVDKYGVTRTIGASGSAYDNGYKATAKVVNDNGNNGHIQLESTLLVNAPKTINLKITNSDGQSENVKIVQYPLEYITPILCYQSYRTDFGGTKYKVPGEKCITSATINYNRNGWSLNTGSSGTFVSKVALNIQNGLCNINYYYYWNQQGNAQTKNVDDLNNSNMYHVRITAASTEYTLGVPTVKNGYTENTAENAKMVSPSFMIASQLGAVLSSDWTFALANDHCSKYVEATKDGTEYKNWRLPTQAELEIIGLYQSKENSAMDIVLGGRNYWGVNGSDGNIEVNPKGNRGPFLRCIRDVHSRTTN